MYNRTTVNDEKRRFNFYIDHKKLISINICFGFLNAL